MTLVKQQELQQLLMRGAEKAQGTSRNVLVSQMIEIPSVDPLSFFAIGQTERFFWEDADRQAAVAGSGVIRRFKKESGDGYSEMEQQRQELLEHSVVDTPGEAPVGGPVFFGGFAFDPLKKQGDLWRSFPDAELVLPAFMLTVADGRSWLTTNCIIDAESDPAREAERLLREQRRLAAESRAFEPVDQPCPPHTVTEAASGEWKDAVSHAVEEIRNGGMEKIVLTRELEIKAGQPFSPLHVLRRLRDEQPNSFLFAVEKSGNCFLGASPERLVKREGEAFISTCLAGSIARGATSDEDEKFGQRLLNDSKNLHEHEVVVHMIKEAIGRVCPVVEVPDKPVLYRMRDIQHLYTPVIGRASTDTPLLQVVRQLHPTPALGGFPQETALEKIREKEPHDRGWYAGPIGWVDYKGNGEFAVAIRSGLLRGDRASLFAGSGIVADSDPENEYRETQMKFRPMLSALGGGQ